MKKLVLVVSLLLLVLVAGSAFAAPIGTYTLTNTKNAASYLDVLVSAEQQADMNWLWTYQVTQYGAPTGVTSFDITLGVPVADATVPLSIQQSKGWESRYLAPTNLINKTMIYWSTTNGALALQNGVDQSQSFSFLNKYGPAQMSIAAAQGDYGYSGSVAAPTSVPEPSSLVGFGTALMVAAPGMVGWIKRRRS